MLKIIRSDKKNLDKLLSSSKNGLATFRYFDKRDSSIIHSHLISIIMIENDNPVAYGHIEEEDGKHWLGILVSDSASGRGIGNKMMKLLVDSAFLFHVEEVCLTVDLINTRAIKLYEKFGFEIVNKKEKHLLMRLKSKKGVQNG